MIPTIMHVESNSVSSRRGMGEGPRAEGGGGKGEGGGRNMEGYPIWRSEIREDSGL